MACVTGTNIVNDGLVFHFDLENGAKSWKGKPTSNIISSEGLGQMSLGYTYLGIENGWKKYGISGTWANGTYPFSVRINAATFTGGVAYSARCLLKTNVISKFATFGGLNYVNDPNMVSSGTYTMRSLGDDIDGYEIFESKREGFIYSTGYANPTTTQTGYLHSRPTANGVSFDSNTDFVWVKEIQVEEGSFCSRYVNGIRLDTASIIDVSPTQSTITAANLTYRQDDTPTFDGTNDYIQLPSQLDYTSEVSAFSWFKSAGTPSGNYHIILGGIQLEISIYTTGYLRTGVTTSSRYVSNHGSGVTDGNWHYVGFTFDGSVKNSFIDGEYVGTLDGITGSLVNSFDRRIGRFGSSTTYYANGEIPEVKIYNRALTAAEVRQNFEATRSRYGI